MKLKHGPCSMVDTWGCHVKLTCHNRTDMGHVKSTHVRPCTVRHWKVGHWASCLILNKCFYAFSQPCYMLCTHKTYPQSLLNNLITFISGDSHVTTMAVIMK